MTHPAPTKSPHATPSGAHFADSSQATVSVVRPKGDAEGVLSALPFTALTEQEAREVPGPRPVAWLTIRTPHRQTPTATSTCACGRDLRARGQADVLDLITGHEYHRTVCPLRTNTEGRNAA
ncbi:hypothetical protein ACIRL3_40625 [Streptomyces sp. NPDC102384]|uniref:hypothetical protein n=1 Tax=Streptomyces sp. NPDC102384 TaxID=3366166 RepID=UPI003800534A